MPNFQLYLFKEVQYLFSCSSVPITGMYLICTHSWSISCWANYLPGKMAGAYFISCFSVLYVWTCKNVCGFADLGTRFVSLSIIGLDISLLQVYCAVARGPDSDRQSEVSGGGINARVGTLTDRVRSRETESKAGGQDTPKEKGKEERDRTGKLRVFCREQLVFM